MSITQFQFIIHCILPGQKYQGKHFLATDGFIWYFSVYKTNPRKWTWTAFMFPIEEDSNTGDLERQITICPYMFICFPIPAAPIDVTLYIYSDIMTLRYFYSRAH